MEHLDTYIYRNSEDWPWVLGRTTGKLTPEEQNAVDACALVFTNSDGMIYDIYAQDDWLCVPLHVDLWNRD